MWVPKKCQSIADAIKALKLTKQLEAELLRSVPPSGKSAVREIINMTNKKIGEKQRDLLKCIESYVPEPGDPLRTIFDATVIVEILHSNQNIRGPQIHEIKLVIIFSGDREVVKIANFPEIKTEEYDTPLGKGSTTVTHRGQFLNGTFDLSSGHMDIPLKLYFDQSIDIPFVDEDSEIDFIDEHSITTREVSAESEEKILTGSPLNRETSEMTLVGVAEFKGGYPLGDHECCITIKGTLRDLP